DAAVREFGGGGLVRVDVAVGVLVHVAEVPGRAAVVAEQAVAAVVPGLGAGVGAGGRQGVVAGGDDAPGAQLEGVAGRGGVPAPAGPLHLRGDLLRLRPGHPVVVAVLHPHPAAVGVLDLAAQDGGLGRGGGGADVHEQDPAGVEHDGGGVAGEVLAVVRGD